MFKKLTKYNTHLRFDNKKEAKIDLENCLRIQEQFWKDEVNIITRLLNKIFFFILINNIYIYIFTNNLNENR